MEPSPLASMSAAQSSLSAINNRKKYKQNDSCYICCVCVSVGVCVLGGGVGVVGGGKYRRWPLVLVDVVEIGADG